MFVLNLSVAFSLSLLNAAHAYEMPPGELAGVLRHVLRHALRRPFDFVRPPRTRVDVRRRPSPLSGIPEAHKVQSLTS